MPPFNAPLFQWMWLLTIRFLIFSACFEVANPAWLWKGTEGGLVWRENALFAIARISRDLCNEIGNIYSTLPHCVFPCVSLTCFPQMMLTPIGWICLQGFPTISSGAGSVTAMRFSPLCFSCVSLKYLPGRMHAYIGCNCMDFLRWAAAALAVLLRWALRSSLSRHGGSPAGADFVITYSAGSEGPVPTRHCPATPRRGVATGPVRSWNPGIILEILECGSSLEEGECSPGCCCSRSVSWGFVMGHWATTWVPYSPLWAGMFHHFQLTAYCAPTILHGFENHSKTTSTANQTLQHCAQVVSQWNRGTP